MKADRNIQILTTGLKAAHKQLFTDKGLRRPEYPRRFDQIYSILEDQLFALYNAVRQNNSALIIEKGGDIIVTASMMVEFAGLLQDAADDDVNVKDMLGDEK